MSNVQGQIIEIIESLLERSEHDAAVPVTAEALLHGDEGLRLDSLETAELSAILEDELGSDPFGAGLLPETVGDIVAFYADAPAVSA